MSSQTQRLKARALERDRWVECATSVLSEDPTYLASWLVGSLARDDFDEWSDVDLVVVVSDQLAGSPSSDAVFGRLGSVLSTPKVRTNAPDGGRFVSVMYESAFGPVAVDWHWQPRSKAVVPVDARVLFDKLGLALSDSSHQHLHPPRPYQPPKDPREAAAVQVRYFWAMIPTTCKSLGRGWSPSVEDMIQMLERSASEVALLVGERLNSPSGEPLSRLKELMTQMERLGELLQSRGVDVRADIALANEAVSFVDESPDHDYAEKHEPTFEAALATQSVLLDINAQTGAAWRLESRLAGGLLGGAWKVHDSRRPAVLKWADPNSWVPRNPQAVEVVAYIRQAGYPTPAWFADGITSAGYPYSVQEFIPGESLASLDVASAELILDLVRMQRTLSPPTDLSWSSYMRDHVFGKHEAHQRLAAAGGIVAEVLTEALEFARPYKSTVLPDNEMVHCDLSLSNILIHNGILSGVVDIDAAGRGCAVYDVLSGALNGVLWEADPEAVTRLHRFAFETYGAGPISIAVATLVIEGLFWRLNFYPQVVERTATKSRDWIYGLRQMMS